jgi:hypothetical protein
VVVAVRIGAVAQSIGFIIKGVAADLQEATWARSAVDVDAVGLVVTVVVDPVAAV